MGIFITLVVIAIGVYAVCFEGQPERRRKLREAFFPDDSPPSGSPGDPVSRCFRAMEEIRNTLDSFMFDTIAEDVAKALRNREKSEYSLDVEKMSPHDVVYLVITNTIAGVLPLGTFHTYRGLLSMKGNELLRIWNIALSKLESTGVNTPAKTGEERKWMAEQIKNAG